MNVIENVVRRIGEEFGIKFTLTSYECGLGQSILWCFYDGKDFLTVEFNEAYNILHVDYKHFNVAFRVARALRNSFLFRGLRK